MIPVSRHFSSSALPAPASPPPPNDVRSILVSDPRTWFVKNPGSPIRSGFTVEYRLPNERHPEVNRNLQDVCIGRGYDIPLEPEELQGRLRSILFPEDWKSRPFEDLLNRVDYKARYDQAVITLKQHPHLYNAIVDWTSDSSKEEFKEALLKYAKSGEITYLSGVGVYDYDDEEDTTEMKSVLVVQKELQDALSILPGGNSRTIRYARLGENRKSMNLEPGMRTTNYPLFMSTSSLAENDLNKMLCEPDISIAEVHSFSAKPFSAELNPIDSGEKEYLCHSESTFVLVASACATSTRPDGMFRYAAIYAEVTRPDDDFRTIPNYHSNELATHDWRRNASVSPPTSGNQAFIRRLGDNYLGPQPLQR